MKRHWIFLSVLLVFMAYSPQILACENSDISLISYTDNGSSHDYVVQVCIGGGILGSIRGATNATRTFGLGLLSMDGSAVTTTNFTPSITSTETMVTMNATAQGPQGAPYFVNGFLLYVHPSGTSGTPFTCVSSTALCGEPAFDCFDISFTTDVELESISAWGIEGNGNPVAGCTGEPDMEIDVMAALPVNFRFFSAREQQGGVMLNWETASEIDNEYFSVERSSNGRDFYAIGRVEGNNTTDQATEYQYLDEVLAAGDYYYRLKQVDFSGKYSYSSIVFTRIQRKGEISINLYPNPTTDHLFLTVVGHDLISLVDVKIYDAFGSLVRERVFDRTEQLALPTTSLRPGMYTIRLYADQELLAQQRLVKQ